MTARRPPELAELEGALEQLVRINERILAAQVIPPMRDARIVHQVAHAEMWRSIPAVMEAGRGDVEDLAAWLCAELRSKGHPARIGLRWRDEGKQLACVVIVGKFAIDPVEWLRGNVQGWQR